MTKLFTPWEARKSPLGYNVYDVIDSVGDAIAVAVTKEQAELIASAPDLAAQIATLKQQRDQAVEALHVTVDYEHLPPADFDKKYNTDYSDAFDHVVNKAEAAIKAAKE